MTAEAEILSDMASLGGAIAASQTLLAAFAPLSAFGRRLLEQVE